MTTKTREFARTKLVLVVESKGLKQLKYGPPHYNWLPKDFIRVYTEPQFLYTIFESWSAGNLVMEIDRVYGHRTGGEGEVRREQWVMGWQHQEGDPRTMNNILYRQLTSTKSFGFYLNVVNSNHAWSVNRCESLDNELKQESMY